MKEDKEMITYVRRLETSSLFLVLTPLLATLFTLAAIYSFNNFRYYVFLGIALLIIISALPVSKLRTNSLEILKLRRNSLGILKPIEEEDEGKEEKETEE